MIYLQPGFKDVTRIHSWVRERVDLRRSVMIPAMIPKTFMERRSKLIGALYRDGIDVVVWGEIEGVNRIQVALDSKNVKYHKGLP